jgi:hypothetical protein
MDRLHNWAIGATGAMYAAILTALVTGRWRGWLALGLACLAFVVLVVLVIAIRLLRPRIVVGEPSCRQVEVPLNADSPSTPSPFLYLRVWNHPRRGRQMIYDARTMLTFSDAETGQTVGEPIYGRWSNLTKTIREEETTVPRTVDLIAEIKFDIDVAFRTPDGLLYSVNDRSRFLEGGFLNASRLLGNRPVVVDVRAQGSTSGPHIDKTFRFRLDPGSESEDPTLTRITVKRTFCHPFKGVTS